MNNTAELPLPTLAPNPTQIATPPDEQLVQDPELPQVDLEHPPHPVLEPDPPADPARPNPLLPPSQPCCSGRNTTCVDYRYLYDPFLQPQPPPDCDDPDPEGGTTANTSITQALEFIYSDPENIQANAISLDIIKLVLNATIKDDRVPKTFAEVM